MKRFVIALAGLVFAAAASASLGAPAAAADLQLQPVKPKVQLKQIDPDDLVLKPVHRDVLYQWWGPGPASLQASRQIVLKLRGFAEPVGRAAVRYKDVADELRLKPAGLAIDAKIAEQVVALASLSPAPAAKFIPGVEGVDAGIAVGNQYIIVAHDHRIAFFDKSGNALPGKGGFPANMSATAFFGGFLAPKKEDGSVNLDNINRYLGFPSGAAIQCNVNDAQPKFPCVDEFYDTRVLFDPVSKRFFVLSAARHQLWLGDSAANPGGQYDALVRRYVAFAVSKTEDPRDGFHQYMLTESNYRDWPRMAVNGNVFIIAHNASGAADSYVATLLPVAALTAGDKTPPRIRFTQADLGAAAVVPVTPFASPNGVTLLLRPSGATMHIIGFRPPNAQWQKPAVMKTSVTLSEACSMLRAGAIHRNGRIYFTCVKKVQDGTLPRYSVRVVRIPVQVSSSSLSASKGQGFLDWVFGRNAPDDAPGDLVSYEMPSMAVNKNGDMLFGYGRMPFQTQDPLMPEARYTLWYAGEAKQRRSRLLQAGSYQPVSAGQPINFYGKGDFTSTVVDPADDRTFWTALFFGDPSRPGAFKTVVGKIVP